MTQNLTILFDLDGTIINTAPDLMEAHNHVMRKFGYEEKKMADIKTLAGKGAWVMMQRSFKEKINDENLKKRLCEIKGIGEWTAECYMLASLSRRNVWPVKDLGLQAALHGVKKLKKRPDEKEMFLLAESWKPYRSIVANVLWASYD